MDEERILALLLVVAGLKPGRSLMPEGWPKPSRIEGEDVANYWRRIDLVWKTRACKELAKLLANRGGA